MPRLIAFVQSTIAKVTRDGYLNLMSVGVQIRITLMKLTGKTKISISYPDAAHKPS
jgi:hypothetical protein